MTPAEADSLRHLAADAGQTTSAYIRLLVSRAERQARQERDLTTLLAYRAEHGSADPEGDDLAAIQLATLDQLDLG